MLLERENRDFWTPKIEFEKVAVARIVLLLATEFCRQNGGGSNNNERWLRSIVLEDRDARNRLELQAQKTFQDFYAEELSRRVTVRGTSKEAENLDGRTGTILRWDEIERKYLVKLDFTASMTNMGRQRQDEKCYLRPEFLEALSGAPPSSTKKDHQRCSPTSLAHIALLYDGRTLTLEVDKSVVDSLLSVEADFVDSFLERLRLQHGRAR